MKVIELENNLPIRLNKAEREDQKELVNARSGGDSDGIYILKLLLVQIKIKLLSHLEIY